MSALEWLDEDGKPATRLQLLEIREHMLAVPTDTDEESDAVAETLRSLNAALRKTSK